MTSWSFSSIKTFAQCPKKYYHIKIAKDVANEGGDAANYGKKMHLAAEEFIRDGKPLPKDFKFLQPIMDAFNALPGKKHCEIELGVTREGFNYAPCDFDDPAHWWHGVADLVVINGKKAKSVDYKTSKNAKYADIRQLDLIAAGLFLKYPELEVIDSALAFVISGDFVRKIHKRQMLLNYLNVMEPELQRLNAAKASKVWNPVSSPLCKFCPVKSCAHNKG